MHIIYFSVVIWFLFLNIAYIAKGTKIKLIYKDYEL
jgi:hypothetical protein